MKRTVTIIMMLCGCATVSPTEVPQSNEHVEPQSEPLVLGSGEKSLVSPVSEGGELTGAPSMAVVPPGALRVSRIARPMAEMREGPGVAFALTDRILEQGARVIVFEQHGVWTKVLSLGSWDGGWVHSSAISPPKLNKGKLTVNFTKFPTVLAVRPVKGALAFKDGAPVQLDEQIPKGRMFKALQLGEDRTLIWMAEHNAMVWIKGKDMQ